MQQTKQENTVELELDFQFENSKARNTNQCKKCKVCKSNLTCKNRLTRSKIK